MAKVATSVRFDPGTLEWMDEQAKAAGVSRQQFLEGMVEAAKSRSEQPTTVQAVKAQGPSRVERAQAAVPNVQRASSLAKDAGYYARVAAWNKRHGPGTAA
jgi:hypothetical protein